MPRHRQAFWAGVSTTAMVLGMVSSARAQQDPFPTDSQAQGATAQDPFDSAKKDGQGSSLKEAPGAAGKAARKPAEKKPARKSEPEFVQKSLREWQRTLPRGVFEVTRLKATEPPFSGRYATGHFDGTFVCACCDAELFSSRNKFDSGTGWPSFWQPIQSRAIDRAIDTSDAEPRIEVTCHRCGAHLGHVFDDAPATPTGLRFCINSLSLKLRPAEEPTAGAASTRARTRARVKTARSRSRSATRSSRTGGTAKAPGTDSTDPADGTPAAGKTDGDGR